MAKKSKAEPASTRDRLTYLLNILSAILLLVCIIPVVPWRSTPVDQNFGTRFSVGRSYSLLSASDRFGSMAPWIKFKRETCRVMQQYSQPSPMTSIVGSIAAATAKLTGVAVGGAATGCAGWPACKQHVASRCAVYSSLTITGISCVVMFVLSALFGLGLPAFMACEPSATGNKKGRKKLQEKEHAAKFRTMCFSLASLVLSLVAVTVYVAVSSSSFQQLSTTAYYPFPALSAGIWLASIAVTCQVFASYCAVTRVYPNTLFDKKEEEETEASEGEGEGEEANADSAGYAPQLGFGSASGGGMGAGMGFAGADMGMGVGMGMGMAMGHATTMPMHGGAGGFPPGGGMGQAQQTAGGLHYSMPAMPPGDQAALSGGAPSFPPM